MLTLSPRGMDVLAMVRMGKSNKEIASHLGLTVGTVKQYLATIFRRVGVTNRTELALTSGIVGIPSHLTTVRFEFTILTGDTFDSLEDTVHRIKQTLHGVGAYNVKCYKPKKYREAQ